MVSDARFQFHKNLNVLYIDIFLPSECCVIYDNISIYFCAASKSSDIGVIYIIWILEARAHCTKKMFSIIIMIK